MTAPTPPNAGPPAADATPSAPAGARPGAAPVLTMTDAGLYCPAGDFHIDPWRPVARAVITHAHSDHARPGSHAYLATPLTAPVLQLRLGPVRCQVLDYGAPLQMGGARVSLHPAGHVPGSAQVRIEVAGQVWVVSGDYKTEPDRLSTPFEPVRCHGFVSECTFGLPIFDWQPQPVVMEEINRWWAACRDAGRTAMIGAYSLGKAQRILAHVDATIGPILTHGAVAAVTDTLVQAGLPLPPSTRVTPETDLRAYAGALVIAPPGALATPWARRFGDAGHAVASGWMRLRGVRRRRGAERGFVLSDHADWAGLNAAITATGAQEVLVTHGYTAPFARWLSERGLRAGVLATAFAGEGMDEAAEAEGPAALPEAGSDVAGPDMAGPDAAGPDTAGPDTAGPDTADGAP